MLWHWHVLSSCLMLIWLCTSSAVCPSDCSCTPFEEEEVEKGRRTVSCLQGGMTDPLPVDDMDAGMEALDVSAPANNWNSLTLSPVFQRFKMLEVVRVVRSGVVQIGMHTFWGVPSLKVLDLTFNNISTVYDHNFRGLVNLVELRLDDNQIERLPSGVFKHLTELRILTLERNRLGELVPRLFLKLGKLQVLKLSGNQLLELIPEVFKDVLELRTFECRGCGLSRINTQIYHLLPYLTHLDLGNNRMQFIASDEFRDLRRIHSLRLDGNQLPVVLERTFVNQTELRTLCLARNRLAKITNTAFLNLSNLYELDISYNKLNRVEGVVFQPVADTLRKLALSGNHFSGDTVRTVLQTAAKLRELAVADMGLADLPPALFPDHLKALNLSGNQLTELGARDLPHQLVELDISRNKFRGLDERVVVRLEQLKRLRVEGNPWWCDLCHVRAIMERLNGSGAAFGNATCAYPNRLKGIALKELKGQDVLDCDVESEYERDDFLVFVEDNLALVVGGVGIFLFLVACVTFVVCSCLRRRANIVMVSEQQQKREAAAAAAVERGEAVFENPAAIFGDKGEISFKFPLDLTERKVSVSTIDEIKRDTQLHTLPNGTAAGIGI